MLWHIIATTISSPLLFETLLWHTGMQPHPSSLYPFFPLGSGRLFLFSCSPFFSFSSTGIPCLASYFLASLVLVPHRKTPVDTVESLVLLRRASNNRNPAHADARARWNPAQCWIPSNSHTNDCDGWRCYWCLITANMWGSCSSGRKSHESFQ